MNNTCKVAEESLVFRANQFCPLGCQSGKEKFCEAYGSGRFRDEIFAIWKCQSCGLGFTDPIPTEETAHLLYETRESNDFQPNDSKLVSNLKELSARRDVRTLCQEANPKGTMLDFGCGNGTFVLAMQKKFPQARVFGSDQHLDSPSLLDKQTYIANNQLREHAFDFILCRHVLEHTYDPVSFLRYLRTLLRPNGLLAIEVPSLQTAVRKLFGKYWDGFYVPFHPLHFTRNSLANVVRSAGFNVVRESAADMPKIGRSLQNLLGCEYGFWLFALGLMLQPLQAAIGTVTRTSVCLRIIAQVRS